MKREVISTAQGAAPTAPYSQAVKANGFVFVSGQGPIEPCSGRVRNDLPLADQVRLTLENVRAVLEAAGSSLAQVVRCRVFLKSIGDFEAMNKVYAGFFPQAPPARTTVAADLSDGIAVEIDVTALAS